MLPSDPQPPMMLVVAQDAALPAGDRVWGTGGWLPPEQREALDWLTLARLSGWAVAVAPVSAIARGVAPSAAVRWIVIACDPAALPEEVIRWIGRWLDQSSVIVVARAAGEDGALASLAGVRRCPDRTRGWLLRWTGAGAMRVWRCRAAITAESLVLGRDTEVWARLDDAPLVVARRHGRGIIATLGCHPGAARDADGAATVLLRQLLIHGCDDAIAWLDLDGCLVLRMDDPGGAQNVYWRTWSYPKLGDAAWAELRADLRRRHGRISLAYVSGWVDDGDVRRGRLTVADVEPERTAGAIHPSPLVRYVDHHGWAPGTLHDYVAEHRGIQALRRAGLADVELHGHTHMHPDLAAWSEAADRYESERWYRELGPDAAAAIAARPPERHPLTLATRALQRHFDASPTTLISPGDQWTTETLEHALSLGIQLVDSYYLALRHDGRFCWSQHVCAPYLDRPDSSWFDAGLPVVGYFHDREPALEGMVWARRLLDSWQAAGARRLIDFRELAAALGSVLRMVGRPGAERLLVTRTGAPAPVREIPILVRFSSDAVPSRLGVCIDGVEAVADVTRVGDRVGRVMLGAGPTRPRAVPAPEPSLEPSA